MRHRTLRAAAVVVALSSVSHAQSPRDEARRHYEAGRAATQAGEHARAAQEFQAAYDLIRDASLLYNVGVAWENGSDWTRAVAAYRQYLAEAPTAPNRAEVERHIRALEAASAAATRPAEPPPAPAPAPAPVAAPAPAPAPAPTPVTPAPSRSIVPLFVAGGGAVLVGAGAVVGVLALNLRGNLVESCGDGGPSRCVDSPNNRSRLNALESASLATDLLLGVGLAAVAGGVLWYLLAPAPRAATARPRAVSLDVGPSGVALRGTF